MPNTYHKMFLSTAAVSGALAVTLGAMGAHALEASLDEHAMDVYQTAAEYHSYHTLALLAVSILWSRLQNTWLKMSGILFIAGIIIFSGSLYLLAITGSSWLGMITPIGGFSFIAGWLCLAVGATK